MPFPAVHSLKIMHSLEQKGNYSDRLLTLAGGKNKPSNSICIVQYTNLYKVG
jgi:ABC-type hemin transport system ATPase subunit